MTVAPRLVSTSPGAPFTGPCGPIRPDGAMSFARNAAALSPDRGERSGGRGHGDQLDIRSRLPSRTPSGDEGTNGEARRRSFDPDRKLPDGLAVSRSTGPRLAARGSRLEPIRRTSPTSCTTSGGTPAARISACTPRTSTRNGVARSCRGCDPPASTSSTRSRIRRNLHWSRSWRRRRSPRGRATPARTRCTAAPRASTSRHAAAATARGRPASFSRSTRASRAVAAGRFTGPAVRCLRFLVASRPTHHGEERPGHALHIRQRSDPGAPPRSGPATATAGR